MYKQVRCTSLYFFFIFIFSYPVVCDKTLVKQKKTKTKQNKKISNELLAQLGIEDLVLILKERSLLWHGHMECSNSAVKTACDIQVDGKPGPGKPKMTWKQLTERDCREWKLSAINPHDRQTWRSGVRSAMHAASQLPGRGPTNVGYCPCTYMLIKNPVMMMLMMTSVL